MLKQLEPQLRTGKNELKISINLLLFTTKQNSFSKVYAGSIPV